ncbi:MAG: Glu-tRNA(Gln) amidotransferase subunit GatE, partial [Candidatus ainarchaeum sp.]|nr:Glu-tRNA(Gln) amidotransferase subunit GatE [Candidatus ainarchaeum sp.]
LLEEDSARAVEKKDNEVIYSLDRLGIPLIELVVWHDMHNPKDVKTVAQTIGQIFRLTGSAKRGLGSIRQDINISIKNGERTEIKGCQELDLIPEIVNREILRQLNLLEVKKELDKRNIKKFNIKEKKLTDFFKDTESKSIKSAIENKKEIFGFLIPNMKGIFGFEIQPNRRVGTELSSVLKAKTTLKGLFHSDELPNYGILEKEIFSVSEKLNLKENDAFILVMAKTEEIDYIKQVIENRLNQFLIGVPKETRMVIIDGNTEFARELSGSSRMYPETDLLPIKFTDEIMAAVKRDLPLSIEQRKNLYLNDFKISEQLAKKMYFDNYAVVFEKIIKEYNRNPTQVAVFLLEDLINLSRDNKILIENISTEKILEFFSYVDFDKIPKSKLLDVFVYFIDNDCLMDDVITELKIFDDLSKLNLDAIIENIFLENALKIKEQKERSVGLLMGKVMSATNGLVDGKILSEKVKVKLMDFLKKE